MCSTGKFPGVTFDWLERAKKRSVDWEPRRGKSILTADEETELVAWLGLKNLKLDGKTRPDIARQVVLILKARDTALRACSWRKGVVLSVLERACILNGKVSDQWFRSFEKAKGTSAKSVDHKRAMKATTKNALVITASLFHELSVLPDKDGNSLVGTTHPRTGKPIRAIIDAATGEHALTPSRRHS